MSRDRVAIIQQPTPIKTIQEISKSVRVLDELQSYETFLSERSILFPRFQLPRVQSVDMQHLQAGSKKSEIGWVVPNIIYLVNYRHSKRGTFLTKLQHTGSFNIFKSPIALEHPVWLCRSLCQKMAMAVNSKKEKFCRQRPRYLGSVSVAQLSGIPKHTKVYTKSLVIQRQASSKQAFNAETIFSPVECEFSPCHLKVSKNRNENDFVHDCDPRIFRASAEKRV